ncbi:MAG TPA: beta-ketoacyl-ACP synthase II [Pyrinomonadaceae bacterium]|jgi:3-oxoacyl-[acyl-carrier-protein] synthase II
MSRNVVITGVGLLTPLGNTTEDTWAGIVAGNSGIGYITHFDTTGFPVRIAGEVKNFDTSRVLDRKDLKKTDYFIHYALGAAQEAVCSSGLRITPENAERVGVCIGSGMGGLTVIEREIGKYIRGGPDHISPFFVPAIIVNLAAGWVSIKTGAKGPNLATATACSSGAHAIGEAFRLIRHGDADVMICGGSEGTITPMGIGGFAAMRALSTCNKEPQTASRPFDLERDGFVMGEGAGILLLEEYEHALRRGARIYASIVGYGTSSDAFHITQPSLTGEGGAHCMQNAMKDAGVSLEEIDYINAHGSSTPYNDKLETLAINTAFGAHAAKLAVSSTKSMTGHLLGAAGGLEAGITALALYHQFLPPTINYSTPDPECNLDYVPNRGRNSEIRYALSNSFGFGGTNVSLLFKRYDA